MSEPNTAQSTAEVERCLTCCTRFEHQWMADAHYAMTGHQMGWPLNADDSLWPFATHDHFPDASDRERSS